MTFWNNTKTAMLLGAMFALILLAGAPFGMEGLIIALILGGVMNVIAFFYSDKIAIAAMRGREVTPEVAPDLLTMVERLARNANLPMPKVYVCPHKAPNAFATGRSPKRAAVAVTDGALRLLSYDELEGVMAHELAHIKNRDTLISTVAATIAGAITYLGWMAFFMGGGSGRGGNPLFMLALLILGPIAAAIIQMAISRSREYVADADGARIAGTPNGLIGALQKLEAHAKGIPLHDGKLDAMNQMFIIEPMVTTKSFSSIFATHPPVEDRIAKLRQVRL